MPGRKTGGDLLPTAVPPQTITLCVSAVRHSIAKFKFLRSPCWCLTRDHHVPPRQKQDASITPPDAILVSTSSITPFQQKNGRYKRKPKRLIRQYIDIINILRLKDSIQCFLQNVLWITCLWGPIFASAILLVLSCFWDVLIRVALVTAFFRSSGPTS